MEKAGKAYGFIKCDKSKAQIEALMPTIRNLARTPSMLELSIVEGIGHVRGDEELHRTVVRDLREEGKCNYAYEAKLPGATNEQTARELKDIFNTSYDSTLFEPRPSEVYGVVVYEKDKQYIELVD